MDVMLDYWPLIGFLIEDEVYRARYRELVHEVSGDVFSPQIMLDVYEQNFEMLAAYLVATDNADTVETLRSATDALLAHVHERAAAAQSYLQVQAAD